MYTTLISVADLAARAGGGNLPGKDLLIVDCRFDLARPAAGLEAYLRGHVPQAIYAHLEHDLSGPVTAATGRHPLPQPEQFAATLGRWGMTSTTQVVAYDADSGAYAARLWWMLRWVGHRAVAVLDGGFSAWVAAGQPTTTEVPARQTTRFAVQPDRSAWLSTEELVEHLPHTDWRLLDARAPERFAGAVEPIDAVAGHVPGARNHPFATSLGAQGRWLAPEELRRRIEQSQAGVADDHTIAMCGSGVTACHLLLAMEVAGKPGARLYAGSWSEWIRDPRRAVASGTEPR
jgi:thiosulfate/3-mercaptopyruvate sulfurtransferase